MHNHFVNGLDPVNSEFDRVPISVNLTLLQTMNRLHPTWHLYKRQTRPERCALDSNDWKKPVTKPQQLYYYKLQPYIAKKKIMQAMLIHDYIVHHNSNNV